MHNLFVVSGVHLPYGPTNLFVSILQIIIVWYLNQPLCVCVCVFLHDLSQHVRCFKDNFITMIYSNLFNWNKCRTEV